tara:strand:- start:510 stop:1811 length:1302 start_codon:yes stop_codon:yes gene_type:complete
MAENKKATISSIASDYTEDKVFVDRDIQRSDGNWDLEAKASCLRNYNREWVDAPLVFADLRECRDGIDADLDPLSHEYFTDKLNKGYKYVIVDGQHKWRNVIQDFVNNKWAYPAFSELTDRDGKAYNTGNDPKYYHELPDRVKDAINDAEVPVRMHTDLKATEINELFVDTQKGVPLNPQQKRRANRTKLTPWVRALAETNRGLFNSLLNGRGENTVAAAADEEFIVKLLVATVRKWDNALELRANRDKKEGDYEKTGFNLNKKDLDIIYEAGKGIDPRHGVNSPYNKDEFIRFQEIFKKYSTVVCGLSKLPAKTNKKGEVTRAEQTIVLKTGVAWMLWWAVEYYHDNNKSLPNSDKLLQDVELVIKQQAAASMKAWAQAFDIADKTGGEVPSEWNYFFKQLQRPHESSRRNAAKDTFLEAFTSALEMNTKAA